MLFHPCHHCGAPADLQHEQRPAGDTYHVECSNRIDCPEWPLTASYKTSEAARLAWNEMTTAPAKR
jgi:hypothetical protein